MAIYLDIVFAMMLASLVAHQLDAIDKQEWRLTILIKLPEATARNIYIASHVPLLAIIIFLISSPNLSIAHWSKIIIDSGAITHVFVHRYLSKNENYRFHTKFSKSLILAPGIFAGLHIGLLLFAKT